MVYASVTRVENEERRRREGDEVLARQLSAASTALNGLTQRVAALEGAAAPPSRWLPIPDPAKWRLVARDDLTAQTPEQLAALWGKVDAVDPSRIVFHATGGPEGGPYRSIGPKEGDEKLWGNNCRAELGLNDWRGKSVNGYGQNTFRLFREGEHCLTTVPLYLPDGFPVDDPNWKTLFQQKWTQPSNAGTLGTMHEIQVRSGAWHPILDWADVPWSFPAKAGVWVFLAMECLYSQDKVKGWVRYSFTEQGGETATSPTFTGRTLMTQSVAGEQIPIGGPVPCHQRLGLYAKEGLPQMPPPGFGVTSVYVAV